MSQNDAPSRETFGPFVPLLILSVALVVFFAWDLSSVVQQRMNGLRIAEQQQQQLVQAADVENKLRQIMIDLVVLAKQNPDAAALVAKYGVAFQPPVGGQPAAATAPAQAPAPAPAALPGAAPAKVPAVPVAP